MSEFVFGGIPKGYEEWKERMEKIERELALIRDKEENCDHELERIFRPESRDPMDRRRKLRAFYIVRCKKCTYKRFEEKED